MVVGADRGHPHRHARPRRVAGQRSRTRPAPAAARLGGRLRRDHRGDGASPPGARGDGVRGLALAVVRRRRGRDAHPRPGAACCRPCSGSPTRPRPRSTSPTRPRSAATGDRRLPDDHRLRGHAERSSRPRGPPSPRVLDRTSAAPPLGEEPGETWAHGRFDAPYLRDSMLDVGVLVETLETATFWSHVDAALRRRARRRWRRVARREPTIVLCHVSHVYETGCSLYFTVAARRRRRPARAVAARPRPRRATRSIAAGATITHHHAVGTDHRPWLVDEIGETGLRVLRAVKAELDPTGFSTRGCCCLPVEPSCPPRWLVRLGSGRPTTRRRHWPRFGVRSVGGRCG